jgi:hypothetical protein
MVSCLAESIFLKPVSERVFLPVRVHRVLK